MNAESSSPEEQLWKLHLGAPPMHGSSEQNLPSKNRSPPRPSHPSSLSTSTHSSSKQHANSRATLHSHGVGDSTSGSGRQSPVTFPGASQHLKSPQSKESRTLCTSQAPHSLPTLPHPTPSNHAPPIWPHSDSLEISH